MKNINYYIDIWAHRVWSYNYIYEDKLEYCPMIDEPEESLDLMEAYCKIIIAEGKRINKNHKKNNLSYENYSSTVQDAIQQVIRLISDGRDIHLTVEVNNPDLPIKKFDHHLTSNGLLPFENDPFYDAKCILEDIPKVREIVESSKYTDDFSQFINDNWYYFEGYESGSVAVRFRKINVKNDNQFTFDGDMVRFSTFDSEYNGDGVIFCTHIEDFSFDELPYYDEEIETVEDLIKWIKDCYKCNNVLTFEQLSKEVYKSMDYDLNKLMKS